MRFLSTLLSAGLLIAGSLSAKTPSPQRFDDFFRLSKSAAPLKLDSSVYTKLTESPRDYSVGVLLTALDTRFGCQLCREFQPEFDVLAKSWIKGDKKGESRLIFGTLDFTVGRDIFISVRCPAS